MDFSLNLCIILQLGYPSALTAVYGKKSWKELIFTSFIITGDRKASA